MNGDQGQMPPGAPPPGAPPPGAPPPGAPPPGAPPPGHFQPGAPMPGGPYRTPGARPPAPKSDGKAVLSMVLGIVGTVLCCLPLVGPICGAIAIVFYAKFNAAYRASGETLGGKGMAIAGLVCGIVAAAIGTLYTLYWMFAGVLIGTAARSFW